MASVSRIALVFALSAATAGCAGVQVRSVGTNTGQAAFDLSGPDLATLDTEAKRLCPQGHVVMRQWQRSNHPAGEGDGVTNWVYRSGVLSYDMPPDQAQMSIACKA